MYINFDKQELIPTIIQDQTTLQVLMLGYMNKEAFEKTLEEKKVTFFSRSKNRLWTKGEISGNYLYIKEIKIDCDHDTILIMVTPNGPTCHTGATSCFNNDSPKGFLFKLEQTVSDRIEKDDKSSYTNKLFKQGINKVAQKVGEEAVELVIEAMRNNDQDFKSEAADLLYHYLILLKSKGYKLEDIEKTLLTRTSVK